MCLVVDKKKTKEFKESIKTCPDGYITFWKVFRIAPCAEKALKSPINSYYFEGAGTYKPEGKIDRIRSGSITGYFGGCFHANTTRKQALRMAAGLGGLINEFHPDIVVLAIRVHHKDVIAFGKDKDVCFKAFTITKRAWNNVFKKLGE